MKVVHSEKAQRELDSAAKQLEGKRIRHVVSGVLVAHAWGDAMSNDLSKATPDAMVEIRKYSLGEPRLPTPWNWEHGNYWRLTEVNEDGLVRIEKMPWRRWSEWQRCTPHVNSD